MGDSAFHTTQLLLWLERIRAGDLAAREALLQRVSGRLERLARKMLRRFGRLRRWVEAEDVLQNATLRLLRALQTLQPDSTDRFFGLSAEQVRRELLDLCRRLFGPHGLARHHDSDPGQGGRGSRLETFRDPSEEPRELEKWQAFHEQVTRLPAAERAVVDLIYYHGCPRAEAAAVLRVSRQTIHRRWKEAMLRLHRSLNGEGAA
jgi:RNA polymerase sigma factor (sigma-70 family)